jgi:regulator of sirC expression with transglutaminase-like and TPR domain
MEAHQDKHKMQSLISLVDDRDEGVFDLIREQILGYGDAILPYLNDAYDESDNDLLSSRLKLLIAQITLLKARQDIREWKNNNSRNLYEGLIILAKFQYPRLDVETITRTINRIRQELWLEINDNMTALEKVRVLNHLFFDIHMFRGDSKDFFAPENSFINDVIIRKKGNPLTLSSIYSIVAQSVNIPIYGVNMPNHYIVCYTDRLYTQPLTDVQINDILFYINPFNRGEIFSLKEMRHFLTGMKIMPRDTYLLPCSNVVTVQRSINNLINIYENLGDVEKADAFRSIAAELE